MGRCFASTIALLAVLAACAADHPAAPGAVVLDDVGQGHWRAVSTGGAHTCALDLEGRAWCWGSNAGFQLGVEQTASECGSPAVPCSLVPVLVGTGRTFIAISAGRAHTCALATDSVPFCWGSNSDGQLGVGGSSTPEPQIPGTAPMRSLTAGSAHSCGVRTDNVLVCWGSNRFGAVGAGVGKGVRPTTIAAAFRFLDVRTSDERTCARTTSARVMCWGAMWTSTQGDTNYTTIREVPAFVPSLGDMSDESLGPTSACSVDASGFAWCWESNLFGEGGAGPGPGSITPHRVASDEEFVSVSVGAAHACGVTKQGAGFCWGSNDHLQIGATTSEYCTRSRQRCTTTPLQVAGRQRFVSLSAGLGTHVCGVTDRNNLYCWGSGSLGQRGDGTTTPISRVPRLAVDVPRL
jgi:alpha-tubulin suppressor-like RCC1 family protein